MKAPGISKIFIYSFLFIAAIISIFPIFYTLSASFKSNQELLISGATLIPQHFTFANYKEAWTAANFKIYTWNSIYMTALIMVGVLFNSTMGGYVFARGNFRGKKFIFGLFTATMFVGLGSITLYPLLDIAKLFHLNTNLFGVIVIHIFGLHIVQIFLVRGFIQSIPMEIDEAAKMDGCSFFRIFWNIMLPLMKPVIATVGLLTFRAAWNDYLLPLVFTLANPSNSPLTVGVVALKSTGEAASSWNLMVAGTVMSIAPMLVAFIFLNRYFISGLTSGSVKG